MPASAIRDPVLGCLLWQGSKTRSGCGQLTVDGKHRYAHHVEWEKAHGPIPAGFLLKSTCGRPNCIEPAHRELRKR